MNKKNLITLAFVLASALSALVVVGTNSEAKSRPKSPQNAVSTQADQQNLAVTVYNTNLGLVRDVRRIDLPAGPVEVKFMDVASQINPATVQIKPVSEGMLSVLEQNYQYDLLNPQKLLEKYIGKTLKVVTGNGVEVEATLVSTDGGTIWKIQDHYETNFPAQRIIFPEIPENLIAKPTLVWLLDSAQSGNQTVEATYLTSGMDWRADYVMVLDEEDTNANLNGWVTIHNRSGATFTDAALKLVAGDVNRVEPGRAPAAAVEALAAKHAMAEDRSFAEKAFFEYHLYTLGRKTTLKNNETKQISLLSATASQVKKEYVVNGQYYYFRNRYEPGSPLKDRVEVMIELDNSKDNDLGLALPRGIVRVYKGDSDGSRQFIGEEQIDHTPKDEKIRLKIGDAFDVVAERKQTDYRHEHGSWYEMAFEISLRNHKEEPITVTINEPIGGDWSIVEASHAWEKTAAFAARFQVPVSKDEASKLRYRVRVKY